MSRFVLGAGLLALSFLSVGGRAQSQDLPATANIASPDAGNGSNETALAKKLQNPIGDLYSVPFQSNTNFNYGPQ